MSKTGEAAARQDQGLVQSVADLELFRDQTLAWIANHYLSIA
ncbi:MAG: mechanosensitive ion channel family protein, partial [Rhizorhabdus sp.]